MAHGKTIELFLANGTAESLITAELSNWNGKAIKIPRIEVQDCTREDIRGAGVYFLFCKEDGENDSVYIGEAENVYDRLLQHLQDHRSGKEDYYWNSAVVFVGRDLNKAHIRYLENRLFAIAKECNHHRVLTKTTYKNTVLKESQIAAMEEFLENVLVLTNSLGYQTFVPGTKATESTTLLYCKGNNGTATGFVSSGGFTVLKGAQLSDHTAPSFETQSTGYFKLRLRLIAEHIIQDDIFQCDYEFNSPSAASSVILGHSTNGNMEWRTSDGRKLKDL